MNPDSVQTWVDLNQRVLNLHLARLRGLLEGHLAGETRPEILPGQEELPALVERMPAPPAVDTLSALFGLSLFERDLLLLCAGVELESRFAELFAPQPGPTFSLALGILAQPHWSAVNPAAPLRRWRLVEPGSGASLTQATLRIDESILHFLAGAGYLDDRLAGYVEFPLPPGELVPTQQALANRIASLWTGAPAGMSPPVIQLCGADATTRQAVAAVVGQQVGLGLAVMRLDSVPTNPTERDSLARLWERQAALGNQVLLLDCDVEDTAHGPHWFERVRSPLILSVRERLPAGSRHMLSFEVRKPTPLEQIALWRQALCPATGSLNGRLEAVAGHFDLSAGNIRTIAAGLLQIDEEPACELGERLWQACRAQAHPRLGELAQRIQTRAGWEDLVLPEAQLETLGEIAVHVRQRLKVYEEWGFAARNSRGLGISALFSGVSGTGKTMASEVLANELNLDLYRIDLSQVVSKYIGETEKNLRRVFDAAEEGGAILLFDEADALFGKRSEVKDSHDRYANIEVSYLLQRMEAYRGLAILTTNLKDAIDTAFMRRIRFVIQFPFPDASQRAEIWRRIFPPETPVECLDIDRLARLSVTGGNICNIALYAAFLAAEAGQSLRMSHLLRAVRVEYAKIEKPLSEAEIGGWK
ncbi:MAG: ATP-binding protein [Chloroflexota bacterium]